MALADDRKVIEAQIERPLRADPEVALRCHLGLPVVVQVPPILDDGTPFPTIYWLTCPLLKSRIGRLEGAGGVKRMEARAENDPGFGRALDDAHESYRTERDELLGARDGPRPSGGVGGARAGVKCLHAHYAHSRSGAENPVGRLVAEWVEPTDCEQACVVDGTFNTDWVSKP